MTESQLGKIVFALSLFLFAAIPARAALDDVSALIKDSLKNVGRAASLQKLEAQLSTKLQDRQIDANLTANLLAALARTCWLLGDRSPEFDRFEQNQDWFNKADPVKRMSAALWIARLEVDHNHSNQASEFLESIDRMNLPVGPKGDVEAVRKSYGRLNVIDTLAAISDEKKDIVAKLAAATSFVTEPDADQDQMPEYLLAAAKVCQRQKMKTMAAAFARESARLSMEASQGRPGEPYCRTLDMLAELDEANGNLLATTDDRLASLNYSAQFHGKESPLTRARADEFKRAQAKLQDFQRNPPMQEDNPTIRLRGVPSWELTLGRGVGRRILGDRKGAEALYQESLKGADEAGFTAGRAERPLDALADLFNDEESFSEAEGYARRALALRDKRMNEPEEYPAPSLASLFRALWGQGKFREARPISIRLKKMVANGKLQRADAAQALVIAGMTERVFGEEQTAYNDLNSALKLCEGDPKSVCDPKFYILWQNALVLEQTENQPAAHALFREAKRLFSARDKSISDRQRARFYAAIAGREYRRDNKDQIRDWTEAVRFAKIGYGPQDCHTKNDIGYLKTAQWNYRNRHKMKGGMFISSPCDNIDEPEALVRHAEH